jgi:hypothetical protein
MPFLEDSAAPPSAPHEFHASLGDEDKTPQAAQTATVSRPPAEEQIARAIQYVGAYLRQQRDYYFPVALPLSNQHKASMGPYFSAALLDRVRIVELKGQRVSSPWFYAEARALGFDHLPALTHMDSVTYLDVVVFNEMLTERSLFHGLVHAVQFDVLGVERYTERFVQQFMRTKNHFTVPLEAQAFALTSKFLRPFPENFSVEDQVLRCAADGLY